jgi:hypothetical protein
MKKLRRIATGIENTRYYLRTAYYTWYSLYSSLPSSHSCLKCNPLSLQHQQLTSTNNQLRIHVCVPIFPIFPISTCHGHRHLGICLLLLGPSPFTIPRIAKAAGRHVSAVADGLHVTIAKKHLVSAPTIQQTSTNQEAHNKHASVMGHMSVHCTILFHTFAIFRHLCCDNSIMDTSLGGAARSCLKR